MLSNAINEGQSKPSVSDSELVVSVMISTYPLANQGYLVSFFKDGPDGNFEAYDPVYSLDFVATKLAKYLQISSIFLPQGCFYLPPMYLGDFIRSLASDASFFDMTLLSPSTPIQGLLMVKVNEHSFIDHEQEEED